MVLEKRCFCGSSGGSIDTCAEAMRQPSGRRTQTWLWRPPNHSPGGTSLEFQGDAAEVAAEGDDVQSADGSREVRRRTALAERFDFVPAVKILGYTEAHNVRRGPEHASEDIGVVVYERGFVQWVKGFEFGYGFGIVDDHGLRFFLRAKVCFTIHPPIRRLAFPGQ
jgi:hypothetical protein